MRMVLDRSGGQVLVVTSPSGWRPDRVVFRRHRAVTARIVHLEPEVLVHLLSRLHLIGDVPALAHHAAATLVDGKLRVDQVPVVRKEPFDAVLGAALFISGQRQDQVRAGL